jgi:hypothetical protein
VLQRVVADRPVHHWVRAPCHPGHLYQAVSEEGQKNCQNSSHPCHRLFTLLPSGKWYRSIGSRTNKLRDSFYPQAIRQLNSQLLLHRLSAMTLLHWPYTLTHTHYIVTPLSNPTHIHYIRTLKPKQHTQKTFTLICCCYAILYFTLIYPDA